MKTTLFAVLLFLSFNAIAAPKFVQLEASSASGYSLGQAAVLTAHVRIQPTNPQDEIYLSSALYSPNGGPVNGQKVTRISETEGVSITPPLNVVGSYTWHVNVYLQNKVKAAQLETTAAALLSDIARIDAALNVETDPGIRANLESEKNADFDLYWKTQDQLNRNRTGLASEDLVVTVNPAKSVVGFENPVIGIEASRENPVYNVDERAVFFVHVLTDFTGPDGVKEVLAFASVNGTNANPWLPVDRKRLGEKDFSFTTPVLATADIGHRSFSAYLKVRSKAQADNIRSSRSKAISRRAEYIAKRDAAPNQQTRTYFERLVTEMDLTINELNNQLTAILVDVPSSKEFYFDVVGSK